MSTEATQDGSEAAPDLGDEIERDTNNRWNEVLIFQSFLEMRNIGTLDPRVKLEWNMTALAMLQRLRTMFGGEHLEYRDLRKAD